jgi:DNA-binding response OmpR family regulator
MQHSADPPLFTTRIAVVESDRPTAEMLHTFFRLMEFEIALVEPDFDAVDTIRRVAPAVVLLDLDLPDLRALDLAREIGERCEDVAVIFTTACGARAPGHLVVPKPGRKFEELLELLEVVLERC